MLPVQPSLFDLTPSETEKAAMQWEALADHEEERTDPAHWDYSPSAMNRADLYRKTANSIRTEN